MPVELSWETHVAVLAFVKGVLEGHWLRWGIY